MKLIIHTTTRDGLARARTDVRDLLEARLQGIVRVLASHDAVLAALDDPDSELDPLLVLCSDSLVRAGREAPGGSETTPNAVLLIGQLARKGWTCVHA